MSRERGRVSSLLRLMALFRLDECARIRLLSRPLWRRESREPERLYSASLGTCASRNTSDVRLTGRDVPLSVSEIPSSLTRERLERCTSLERLIDGSDEDGARRFSALSGGVVCLTCKLFKNGEAWPADTAEAAHVSHRGGLRTCCRRRPASLIWCSLQNAKRMYF